MKHERAAVAPFPKRIPDVTPLIEHLRLISQSGEKDQLVGSIGYVGLASANETLEEQTIAESMEQQGVVKEAPSFIDQVNDKSRQKTFRMAEVSEESYKMSRRAPALVEERVTESDGLREVYELLTKFVSRKSPQAGIDKKPRPESIWVSRAKDMLENLTFIGVKEHEEAARGIGLYWKSFLEANPGNKICILTDINKIERYWHTRKSGNHLKDTVLESFSDEELERYAGRIVDDLDDMDADLEHGKVIMLDDWSISGSQMRDVYHRYMQSPTFQKFNNAGRVEANFIVSSADRIRNGLHIFPGEPSEGTIPVKAYYQSHYAKTSQKAHHSYVTGLHSPVNYGFLEMCQKLARRLPGGNRKTPMLGRIVPDYHDDVSTIKIDGNELRRLSDTELVEARAIKQAGVLAVSAGEKV